MKIVEFANPGENKLNFDVVDDVCVYMRNDPTFYRKSFFPTMSRIADMHRAGKEINAQECMSGMIESGLNSYCKKYKVASIPDEVFTQDDRDRIIDKLFSEEMEQIKQGEYK
jgi:hypothetical protein